ncbi:MAG: hypothetical protein ACRC8P_01830 [Spiroplasma sp.]
MGRFKYVLTKQLTTSRALMSVGALWIIIYGILVGIKLTDNVIFGWYTSGPTLILIGLFYILIPFSTKPGLWSRTWAIFLTLISIIMVIGFFINKNPNYQSIWTYLEPMPHILMSIGAILWIIQS